MDSLDWVNLLADKDQLIQELRAELEDTNKGILHLVMELEYAAEKQQKAEKQTIHELEIELAETDHGLLALTTELELAREKYRNILEHASEAIITFDSARKLETWNAATEMLFGYSGAELADMAMTQLIPYFDDFLTISNEFQPLEQSFLRTKHDEDFELYAQHKNSNRFPIEITLGKPFYSEKKTWMIILRDISQRKSAEERLRLMAKVFQDSNNAIMITNTEGVIVEVNQAFTLLTGYLAHEVLGLRSRFMQSGVHDIEFYRAMWGALVSYGFWNGEIWDKKKDGSIYPKWLSISSVKDKRNQTTHYIGAFTDITNRKEVESKLLQLAHYDQLTGLPNRAQFLDKLQIILDTSKKNHGKVALMFMDLDRFKIINDTLGHQVGDQLLVEVANRLQETLRNVDLIARLAGDEFTILISDIVEQSDIEEIAKKILKTLLMPILIADREIYISGSLGIAMFPEDGQEVHSLLKNADIAMYHAKSQGKNTYAFYARIMIAKLQDQLELENNIRRALPNGEFSLVYQPQVRVTDQQVIGVEALIRWRHPQLGSISPNLFISIAEQTGLIIEVGNWVLKSACQQFVAWQQAGHPAFKMSVNYSGVQLKQSNQIEKLSAILAETGMDPRYLCLEMTESVAMEDAENTIKTLRGFKEMGISISIDDFGTGYSSLSYLKRFPIDMLKIDRSFITDILENPDDAAIASTIIAIAHQLRLSVIAEGVESLAQLQILKSQGCDLIQGYYFSPPVSADQLISYISQLKN